MTALGLGLGGALSPFGVSGTTSFLTVTFTTHTATISDTIGMAPAIAQTSGTFVDEGIGVLDALLVDVSANLFDTIGMTVGLSVIKAVPGDLTDTVSIAQAETIARGILIAEGLGLLAETAQSAVYNLTLSDTASIEAGLTAGVPASISEIVGVTPALQAAHVIQVVEGLGLRPALDAAAIYGLTLNQTFGLADSLAQFVGGEISETISLAPVLAGVKAAPETISETVGIAEAVAPTLLLRVEVEDTISIEPDQALSMMFSGVISEGVEITAAYLAPGDTFTTWAMNTRTGAVTEYSNYAFNSFAKLGNWYVGASSSGLYELVGDNDAGTDIVAEIKSGFMQWAGSRFSLFKGVYIATRGEGDFVLKLITGEGSTYHYSVTTRDMRTTKVHLGKGLRSRYFAFELISAGQNFDLDTIEFVPLVADRRV